MIQMVNRSSMTSISQDRETLTFKALLYSNVAVHAQVCRLFCVVYTAISIYVVGSKLQTYATRPNGSMGRSRRLLHVPNTNEV